LAKHHASVVVTSLSSRIKDRIHLSDPYLVGGFNPSEKYESQLGRIITYIMEKKNV
jgi:hypothetical protein